MKKVFILFLFLAYAGTSFSQTSLKDADHKFATLLEDESYVKQLPELLSLVVDNPNSYSTSKTFNSVIVLAVRNNGIGTNEEVHRHLRNYFGSTDPAIVQESETYLLENL